MEHLHVRERDLQPFTATVIRPKAVYNKTDLVRAVLSRHGSVEQMKAYDVKLQTKRKARALRQALLEQREGVGANWTMLWENRASVVSAKWSMTPGWASVVNWINGADLDADAVRQFFSALQQKKAEEEEREAEAISPAGNCQLLRIGRRIVPP
jgi:hypothetical protein